MTGPSWRLGLLKQQTYQLKGNCSLIFIGDSATKLHNMKHFGLLHHNFPQSN